MMCYSQNDSLNLKKDTMKRLDSNKFKDLPLDNNRNKIRSTSDETFYRTDKERIRVSSYSGRIGIEKEDINTPYGSVEVYSEKTKSLLLEGKIFSRNIKIEIWKEYDENGELIKETDWDSGYQFSIDSLIEKMKKEYDIDVLNRENTWVYRSYGEEKFYEVGDRRNYPTDWFLLDGNTGALLYRAFLEEDDEALYEQYVKYLKK